VSRGTLVGCASGGSGSCATTEFWVRRLRAKIVWGEKLSKGVGSVTDLAFMIYTGNPNS
jgi:hypothetical protein